MDRDISIADAKNRLTAIVREVEKGYHLRLTRRGKAVAVLMSNEEYESLSQNKAQFWESYLALKRTHENQHFEITDADFEGLRDGATGRDVDL